MVTETDQKHNKPVDESSVPHEYGDRPAWVGVEHGHISIGRWESEQQQLREQRDKKAK